MLSYIEETPKLNFWSTLNKKYLKRIKFCKWHTPTLKFCWTFYLFKQKCAVLNFFLHKPQVNNILFPFIYEYLNIYRFLPARYFYELDINVGNATLYSRITLASIFYCSIFQHSVQSFWIIFWWGTFMLLLFNSNCVCAYLKAE